MVCSLIIGSPVYDALKSYCKMKGITYDFASNPEDAKSMIERNISQKKDGTWSLTIFDDFNQGNSMRTNPYNNVQIMAYQMLRNYSNHSICITQDYSNVSTLARNNMNLMICFRMKNRYSIMNASKDFENLTGHSSEDFQKLYKNMIETKHSYVLVSENRTYIYIPKKTSGLEEVEFNGASENDMIDDKRLSDLIERAERSPIRSNLQNLYRYIKKMANENDVPIEQLIKKVNNQFGIDIKL